LAGCAGKHEATEEGENKAKSQMNYFFSTTIGRSRRIPKKDKSAARKDRTEALEQLHEFPREKLRIYNSGYIDCDFLGNAIRATLSPDGLAPYLKELLKATSGAEGMQHMLHTKFEGATPAQRKMARSLLCNLTSLASSIKFLNICLGDVDEKMLHFEESANRLCLLTNEEK